MCSVEFQSAGVKILAAWRDQLAHTLVHVLRERLITAKSARLTDKTECWRDRTCVRCVNYSNMITSTTFIHG